MYESLLAHVHGPPTTRVRLVDDLCFKCRLLAHQILMKM